MIEDDSRDTTDERRWEAVEEASELLLDGNQPAALALLKTVLVADSGNAYAYYHVGVAMRELNQNEASRDAFAAAVAVAPEYLAARLGLAHALRKTGDILAAITEARDTLERFPHDGDAHFAIALAFAAVGDKAAAVPHLELFLRSGAEVEEQMEAREMLAEFSQGDGAVEPD